MLPVTVEKRISNLLVLAGPATCLAISPWFNFDPINLIKVLVLTCFSFATLGLILPYLPNAISRVGKRNSSLLLFFSLALISPLFFSGANKAQQFWGVFGRNTGILSYLALVSALFVTASLKSNATYTRILWSLVVTVAIMSAYCLVQIANLDPISWSAFFPFGTLGNVNFLSGFMGLGLVTVFIFILSRQFSLRMRLILLSLLLIGIFVLIKSDSTQGIVALAVGVASYLLVRSWYLHRALFIVALILYSSGLISLVLGLLDKGPLRGIIYQFTVLYRADYMHAGLAMLMHNPFFGVGIDSYDDWYRAERGIISAVRTSLSRTANSAHNISIDLAAGGGFPLLFAYSLILGAILLAIIRGLRNGRANDPFFMALSMSWFAYQVQASVSINQIGVGVWGWLLGGALLGYTTIENHNLSESSHRKNEKMSKRDMKSQRGLPNTPPAIAVVSSATLLAIGFTLAFLPLKTDVDFARASKIGSAQMLLEVTSRPTSNAFMLQKTAQDTFNSNLPDIARVINERLKSRFPRNIGGWLTTYENSAYTQVEREEALKIISKQDPYVYLCYLREPTLKLRQVLDKLPPSEKYRLALGWGFTRKLNAVERETYSFSGAVSDQISVKLGSLCGY